MINAIFIVPVIIVVHLAVTMRDFYKEYKENSKKDD